MYCHGDSFRYSSGRTPRKNPCEILGGVVEDSLGGTARGTWRNVMKKLSCPPPIMNPDRMSDSKRR